MYVYIWLAHMNKKKLRESLIYFVMIYFSIYIMKLRLTTITTITTTTTTTKNHNSKTTITTNQKTSKHIFLTTIILCKKNAVGW